MIAPLLLMLAAPPQRPLDVRTFVERREGCDHWRGEYSEDPPRRRQIERGVKESCTGIDRQLVRLRYKYRRVPRIVAALRDYDKVELR